MNRQLGNYYWISQTSIYTLIVLLLSLHRRDVTKLWRPGIRCRSGSRSGSKSSSRQCMGSLCMATLTILSLFHQCQSACDVIKRGLTNCSVFHRLNSIFQASCHCCTPCRGAGEGEKPEERKSQSGLDRRRHWISISECLSLPRIDLSNLFVCLFKQPTLLHCLLFLSPGCDDFYLTPTSCEINWTQPFWTLYSREQEQRDYSQYDSS